LKSEEKEPSWPGLKAKDHLSRVVTRAVKEAYEDRKKELWAKEQIALILDCISAEAAIEAILRETIRRKKLSVAKASRNR
jgi:lipoprotein NlpI